MGVQDSFVTIDEPVEAEIEEKRSRFLALAHPAPDEAAARAVIGGSRRQFHDARHHCSAFVLGPDGAVQRSNDDGEPSGTAGMPILDVLRGSGLTDVVVVVTRWFGGTLLGAGGLVRAYSEATAAALALAVPVTWLRQELCDLAVDHSHAGRVEAALRAHGVVVLGTDYGMRATLHLATGDPAGLDVLVREQTAGAGVLVPAGSTWVRR